MSTRMNYGLMAQQIRHERVELFRSYASLGYGPAWSKLVYMGMGMDVPMREIEAFYAVGDLMDQELQNPYVKARR